MMKIVRVKYLDHYSTATTEEKIDKLGKAWIEELGWLLKEDDTHIYIIKEKWIDENTPADRLNVAAILKAQITEMEVIKE